MKIQKRSILILLLIVMLVLPTNSVSAQEAAVGEAVTEVRLEEEPDPESIPAEKVILSQKRVTLGAGLKLQLSAQLEPAESTDRIRWYSDDETIVKISKKGKIIAVAAGKTKVWAEAQSGKRASCVVTVKPAPSKVSLNYKKKTLTVGDTLQLKAKQAKGTFRSLTWSSSAKKIASVSAAGKVKAKKAGTAKITVKTYNGKKATCTVTVRPKTKKITPKVKDISLKINKEKKLKVIFKPKGAKEKLKWSSSNTKVAKVSKDGTVKAVGIGTATITAETVKTHKKAKFKVTTWNKQVALTFDDGPSLYYTPELLDGLKKRGIHCTFFMVGQNAARYPDYVKRIHDEGHEIGNHSWDHARLTTLSYDGIVSEFNRTKKAIYDACGAYPTLFRSPYGAYNSTVLSAAGLPQILWSVDPEDWARPGKSVVTQRIVDNAFDGAIILCHDIHPDTPAAALAAIDILQAKGYKFVTVTELLTRNGKKIYPGETYRKAD